MSGRSSADSATPNAAEGPSHSRFLKPLGPRPRRPQPNAARRLSLGYRPPPTVALPTAPQPTLGLPLQTTTLSHRSISATVGTDGAELQRSEGTAFLQAPHPDIVLGDLPFTRLVIPPEPPAMSERAAISLLKTPGVSSEDAGSHRSSSEHATHRFSVKHATHRFSVEHATHRFSVEHATHRSSFEHAAHTVAEEGRLLKVPNFHDASMLPIHRTYSVSAMLATGGFSNVYLGLCHDTGELICLKQPAARSTEDTAALEVAEPIFVPPQGPWPSGRRRSGRICCRWLGWWRPCPGRRFYFGPRRVRAVAYCRSAGRFVGWGLGWSGFVECRLRVRLQRGGGGGHQQEHRPQRPTESSDPTQHAKGRPGDCPGPRKETTTKRNVTQEATFWVRGRGPIYRGGLRPTVSGGWAGKAVGGGYCRLQLPLKLALGVRGTVAGHRLGALMTK